MEQDNFKTVVTDDFVDVAWNDNRSIGQRIVLGLLISGLGLVLWYASLFQHGKKSGLVIFVLNNPMLLKQHIALLYINVIGIIMCSTIFGYIFISGIRYFFHFGNRLHCDHSTFTISKIAFWSFGNRWQMQSALPSDVSQARYGVVQSGKGGNVYGIRADVRGKSWKVFAGIDASEAKRILQGLNRMGVNVILGNEKID